MKFLNVRAGAALAALALGLGGVAASVPTAPPAAAAECHPDGSNWFCGEVVVLDRSECAVVSFGGWSKAIGGYGTGGSIVRPGQSSKMYHKDSDGTDPDDRCYWLMRSGTEWIDVSAKSQKNWTGSRIVLVGYRR